MYRTNERQIEIILNIDENERHLPKLSDPRYKYSQLFKRQGFIKYYAAGVSIQSPDSFRRSLNREDKTPMFTTPLVLCLSIDSKIEPDNNHIFKKGRGCYIPFGVEIQSIKLDDLVYNNFPQTTDFSLITIESCGIDLKLKQAKIKGTVGVDFTLDETEYDQFQFFRNKIEPLYAHIQKVMIRPDIDLYESELISNEVFKMSVTFLKSLGLLYSHANESNRHIREKLTEALMGTDKAIIGPDGSVLYKERSEDETPKKQPFAMGLYEYKGAYFKDKLECDSSIKYAEMFGQTEEEIVANQKIANRYEYMVYFLTEDQRINEITEEEINSPEFVIYAMTEEERAEYETLRSVTTDKGKAARLEIARAAKLRWKVAQGRV